MGEVHMGEVQITGADVPSRVRDTNGIAEMKRP